MDSKHVLMRNECLISSTKKCVESLKITDDGVILRGACMHMVLGSIFDKPYLNHVLVNIIFHDVKFRGKLLIRRNV